MQSIENIINESIIHSMKDHSTIIGMGESSIQSNRRFVWMDELISRGIGPPTNRMNGWIDIYRRIDKLFEEMLNISVFIEIKGNN
jgi:hypothetical protein